jgi:hypothetical protein
MNAKGKCKNQLLMNLTHRGVSGSVALLVLLPVAAWAGGVVTNCTEADLRGAMAGGGTVTFACDGTITLANTITIESDTTLDGSGRQITISGNRAVRVFYVNGGFTVVNLTIADGLSPGGGSAIYNGGGTVNASRCTFVNNTAFTPFPIIMVPDRSGGAICNVAGQVNLHSCAFVGNGAFGANFTSAMPSGSGRGGGAPFAIAAR